MSIASDLITYIKAQQATITDIKEDTFGADPVNQIKATSDPSIANKKEHIDGSTTGTQQITFYARNTDPAAAQAVLNLIGTTVDKKEIALTGLQVLRVQKVSTVSFVNKETTGESIYSTTVDVDFDGKNPY
jgi:hypothetical protein